MMTRHYNSSDVSNQLTEVYDVSNQLTEVHDVSNQLTEDDYESFAYNFIPSIIYDTFIYNFISIIMYLLSLYYFYMFIDHRIFLVYTHSIDNVNNMLCFPFIIFILQDMGVLDIYHYLVDEISGKLYA